MRRYLVIALLLFVFGNVFSQDGPEPPIIKYISVNPVYGNVTIEWNASSSHPDSVLAYKIHRHLYEDALGNLYPNYQVGLVLPSQFQYTDPNPQTKSKQVLYTMSSDGPTVNGGFSAPHASIYGVCTYDSCAAEMTLKWTKYQGWDVAQYNIYYGNSSDLSSFVKINSIYNGATSYVHTGIFENQSYKYYIEAIKLGDPTIMSTSKIISKYTYMPTNPNYIRIDSVINNSNTSSDILVNFEIDSGSELKDYRIKKQEVNSSGWETALLFKEDTYTLYNDLNSNGISSPIYYKIEARNSCDNLVSQSNIANSISTKIENEESVNTISWDQYKPTGANPITYKLYRSTNDVFGLLYESQNIGFIDNVEDIEYNDYSNKFCYYVLAEEYDDSLISTSRSNIQCVYIHPKIHLPNAIAPNQPPDNEFKPTLSFNANYLIQIYSRWGNLVYSGENGAWNGVDSRGALVKAGTYGYFVRVTTEDNKIYEYKGTVSVFY